MDNLNPLVPCLYRLVKSSVEQILEKYKMEGYSTEQSCIEIEDISNMERPLMQTIGQWGVLVFGGLNILKEIFQVTQARLSYFRDYQNAIEWITYALSIVFVLDFTACQERTGLRFGWQWQLGAFAVMISWVNLLQNVRKFPFLGIYVLMISDVLKTFIKVFIVISFIVIGFTFGFHCLLAEQVSPIVERCKRLLQPIGEIFGSQLCGHCSDIKSREISPQRRDSKISRVGHPEL